ncbi:MAG: hypothetical protein AAGC57_16425 [Pseudomonadota bacterium]
MRVPDDIEARLARWGVPAVGALTVALAVGGMIYALTTPSLQSGGRVQHVSLAVETQSNAAKVAALAEAAEHLAKRPLFVASRRPWQAPEAPKPQPAPIREPNLLGIVGYGDEYLALVSDGGSDPARRVGPGHRVGVWTVTDIGPDRVEFVGEGGRKLVLRLDRSE